MKLAGSNVVKSGNIRTNFVKFTMIAALREADGSVENAFAMILVTLRDSLKRIEHYEFSPCYTRRQAEFRRARALKTTRLNDDLL
jgi:hypothetical protein